MLQEGGSINISLCYILQIIGPMGGQLPDKIIENVVGGEIGDDGGPEEPPSQASCPGLASQTTRPAHADTRHGSRLIKASSVPIN